MLQTTNLIFNLELYNLVKPQSLFAWQRVRVANMMAHSGYEWYHTVRMYNSGIFTVMLCNVLLLTSMFYYTATLFYTAVQKISGWAAFSNSSNKSGPLATVS